MVWLWGSGQEAFIHPRTRSVYFSLTKTKGKKHNKTGVNRLMRPEQLWGGEGGEGPDLLPLPDPQTVCVLGELSLQT